MNDLEIWRERDDLERDPWRERFGELDVWKLQGLVYLARIVKETGSTLHLDYFWQVVSPLH